LTAATLANCAQFPVSSLAAGREASREHNRKASFLANRRVHVVTRQNASGATNTQVAETQNVSDGLASFYGQSSRSASGETFDARELTAAHRTLPFGTRVRVTNVATGQSVTVRVTDRGPFIPGRVVDVSRPAAEALGIVERGVAKVKLDVVQ